MNKVNKVLSRRRLLVVSGCGAIGLVAGRAFPLSRSETQKRTIDRSRTNWGERSMFLRPYHPPYLIAYYGERANVDSAKWGALVSRVDEEPDLKIRFIEAFDDACAGCPKLETDPMGSVWGVGQTCPSAKDPAMVAMVTRTNRRILGELGLSFGDEISLGNLVPLLKKRVPLLYEGIGGEEIQQSYEKGLRDLSERFGR